MTIGSALVTGASGFIGSALVRRLSEQGTRLTCVVRSESSAAQALRELRGVELLSIDGLASLAERSHDFVFNLASYGVRPGDRDTQQLIDGNLGVLVRVLHALDKRTLQRFVHVGSCSEYARREAPELLDEDTPLEPTSLYGAAKAAAHVFGTTLARELGIELVSLRPFGTYGPGEAEHRLIPHLVSCLRRGETARMTSGEQFRDFTYVEDVVEALLAAAQAPSLEPYRAYNVCSGVPIRIRDVAQAVARLMDKPAELLGLGRVPLRQGETPWVVGDPTRFRVATGWAPRVTLEQGILRMLEALIATGAA